MRREKSELKVTIGPALQHPGTDRMTVLWETDAEVSGEVICSDAAGNRVVVRDPRPATLHRSILTGLASGASYTYSIAADGRTLANGSFRTLPERGPYRFVIFGDPHAPADGFAALAPLIKKENPDFIVILGDMVASGRDKLNWAGFFAMGRSIFDRIPFTTIIGNHDVKRTCARDAPDDLRSAEIALEEPVAFA